jgi:hypothetical protein
MNPNKARIKPKVAGLPAAAEASASVPLANGYFALRAVSGAAKPIKERGRHLRAKR